jgi:hypothetical protein
MATVRFSMELVADIEKNARALHKNSIEKARSLPDDFGFRLYKQIFSEDIRTKMEALPLYFFEQKHELTFDGFTGEDDKVIDMGFGDANGLITSGFWCTPKFSVSGLRFPVDIKIEGVQLNWRGCYLNAKYHKDTPIWDEYLAWGKRVYIAEKNCKDFVDGVMQVVGMYSTLAPALKAWPALWDLIPPEKQLRHKEIVERKSAKVVEDLDTKSLTASVTMAKLVK